MARLRKLKLGIIQGTRVEVLEGLKPGDRLIVIGQRAVEDGAPIKITRTVESVQELAR